MFGMAWWGLGTGGRRSSWGDVGLPVPISLRLTVKISVIE